jgi:hypothetical protein
MPNSNETLFDELIIALIVIERFKSSIAKKIKNILLNVNDEILKEVLTVVLSLKNISELKGRKLKNVLNKIEEITGESFDKVEEKTTAALLVLIPLLVNSTNKIINKSVGVGVSSVTLSDKKIADILNNAVIDGKFIADWWKRAELKTTEAIKSAIKQGIFDRIIIESQRGISKGESIDDITNRIKDVIGVNSKQAASVSDTIIAQVTNTVREYVFKQNEGLISGYKFVAILDNRTCLTEDQEVLTDAGYKKITEINEGDYVIGGLSFKNKRVIGKSKSVTKKLAIVTLMNGEKIKCTPDHLFLLEDGRWVEAQELDQEMELKELC